MMDKTQFLARIRYSRSAWDALLAQFDDTYVLQGGTCGGWSIKDVIAHLAWHEREMLGMLKMRALAGSELWDLPLDERNAVIFEMNRERSLFDLRAEAHLAFVELVQALEAMSEEDLTDPRRFLGMPLDWVPWQVLASNTYEHYEEHCRQLRALLAS